MGLPTFSDLRRYIGRQLTNSDWDFNFQYLINVLTLGTYDLSIKNLTASGAATVSGVVTASSFVGDGASLSNIDTVIGSVNLFAGTVEPSKWFICDGRAISRVSYPLLYAAISTNYGSGDGSTTFNIPDQSIGFMRGKPVFLTSAFNNVVDTTNDIITFGSNHGIYRHGYKVRVSTTTALPAGLAAATTYFIRVINTTQVALYDTFAHAIDTASTTGRVDLTADGTGVNTMTQYEDPDYASRTASAHGSGSAGTIGSYQLEQIGTHTHTYASEAGAGGFGYPPKTGNGVAGATVTGATGGNETRPQNLYFNWIIRHD